jgi:glycosyltransferase involved in cell wall biosynthesis
MKIVDILTSEMHQIHGANRVTEKLIKGKDEFAQRGYNLRYVFSQDGTIDCHTYEKSVLGSTMGSSSYKGKRKIIDALKSLSIYKTYPVQKRILNRLIAQNSTVLDPFRKASPQPDLIIYQDPFTAYIALTEGKMEIPSILISHAADDPLEQLLMNRPVIKGTEEEKHIRELLDFVFHHVDKVVTICKGSQDYMKSTYGLDCPCIINGIEDIENHLSRKKSAVDGKIHIVILASVQYRKGQNIAISALSKLPRSEQAKITLHLAGGGQGIQEIENLVKTLNVGSSVDVMGPVLEVDKLLPTMDAFLLPSRADTVPIAILEAMRAELPVFASNVGEIPQMLDGCGVLIEANVESVLKMFEGLLNGRYDLQQMGMNARKKYLKEYNLPSMISKYCDVLDVL